MKLGNIHKQILRTMINRLTLLGNVGKDPEIKKLDGDRTVASFPLATSETYKDKSGEKVTKTEWHNITVWGALAGVVEKWVKKGQLLYLEGKVETRSYEDKEGNKKYVTNVVCNVMQMVGKASTEPAQLNEPAQKEEPKQSQFQQDGAPPPTAEDEFNPFV